ncbi:MAG: hypothetical protein JW828_07920 [Sedimentisphaerales bacterium]|nr:hypothetical protein [Sedimentisphaerales bacterium]
MNCFNHSNIPAVGICKSCGKGLCKDCLVEVPDGLACKQSCEERVRYINFLIDSNKQVLTATRFHAKSATIFLFVFGGFVFLLGLIPYLIVGEKGTLFLAALGFVFLVLGLLRLRKKGSFPVPDDSQ